MSIKYKNSTWRSGPKVPPAATEPAVASLCLYFSFREVQLYPGYTLAVPDHSRMQTAEPITVSPS